MTQSLGVCYQRTPTVYARTGGRAMTERVVSLTDVYLAIEQAKAASKEAWKSAEEAHGYVATAAWLMTQVGQPQEDRPA